MTKHGIAVHDGQVKHVSFEKKHTMASHCTVGTAGGNGEEFKTQAVGMGMELEAT